MKRMKESRKLPDIATIRYAIKKMTEEGGLAGPSRYGSLKKEACSCFVGAQDRRFASVRIENEKTAPTVATRRSAIKRIVRFQPGAARESEDKEG